MRSFAPHNNALRYPWVPTHAWTPVAPFNQTEGDLSLFGLLPNSITFSEPVQDPMFRTSTTSDNDILGLAPYVPERDMYLLACSEKLQICNPRNGKCTGWNSTLSLNNFAYWSSPLGPTEQQNATYLRLAAIGLDGLMFNAVNGVPDPLLASAYLLSTTGSQPLPDGYWRAEVEGWFQSVLAKTQLYPTMYPNMPQSVLDSNDLEFFPAESLTPALLKQCKQQRVAAPQRYQC